MNELIDVHSHFVTEEYVAAATQAGHHLPEGMPAWATWSAEEHLALMDKAGIRTSVLSVSAPGTHFGDDARARTLTRRLNTYAAEVVARHPGRFAFFAALPLPDVAGARAEVGHAFDELGAVGVVLLSNAHGVYPGDRRYDDLYAELNRRRAVVFVHPLSSVENAQVALNRPSPILEFLFDSARAASDLVFGGVLTRFPEIRWVFSHSGGVLPLLADRMQLFRHLAGAPDGPPVTEQLAGLWYDIAGTPFPHAVPALVRAFGADRVLYGSDYCWTPLAGALGQIAAVDGAVQPPGNTWRGLTTRNAERLLPGLLGPAAAPHAGGCPHVTPSIA
ncbi:amidohydrolase family protein [Micromonospora mangrovi]|uniref:Amidohydrolase family protein n=2 Tax=Micromonospora TaxID=1873 RepID=A0AAU7MA02_9ACTN